MANQNTLYLGQWNVICSSCMIEKDITNFYLHSNGKPRKQCKECRNQSNRKWVNEHKDQVKLYIKDKEKLLEATRQWRKRNLAYDAQRQRERTARKIKATPLWANKEKIQEIYNNCPKGYHVDHIVPLKGKNVSGFHVEHNLQYLPAKENLSKRNSFYD